MKVEISNVVATGFHAGISIRGRVPDIHFNNVDVSGNLVGISIVGQQENLGDLLNAIGLRKDVTVDVMLTLLTRLRSLGELDRVALLHQCRATGLWGKVIDAERYFRNLAKVSEGRIDQIIAWVKERG